MDDKDPDDYDKGFMEDIEAWLAGSGEKSNDKPQGNYTFLCHACLRMVRNHHFPRCCYCGRNQGYVE